jgi:hypothetical protein
METLDTGVFSHNPTTWTVSCSPGKYRYMYRIESGESSITCGLFLVDGTGKTTDWGFIEFNPQKVLRRDVAKLWQCIEKPECVRWDLAVDYNRPRSQFALLKGQSSYELYCGKDSSVTEYRGQRNHAGRVKLYDKARELGLPDGQHRTRVELTIEPGGFSWPKVLYLDTAILSDKVKAEASFALCAIAHGATIEDLLSSLDNRQTRYRWRKRIEQSFFTLAPPMEQYIECANQVEAWELGQVLIPERQ